jgi:hypothetical protein
MKGKSVTRNAASMSSSKDTFKLPDEESTATTGSGPASSLPSIAGKRSSDVFASSYSSGNLDFGSGTDATEKIAQDAPGGTTSLADISDGAKRLAQELDQYITRGPDKTAQGDTTAGSALSDDAIADLQLATARKLREVGAFCSGGKRWSRHFDDSGVSNPLSVPRHRNYFEGLIPNPYSMFFVLIRTSAFIPRSFFQTIEISSIWRRNGIGFRFCSVGWIYTTDQLYK